MIEPTKRSLEIGRWMIDAYSSKQPLRAHEERTMIVGVVLRMLRPTNDHETPA